MGPWNSVFTQLFYIVINIVIKCQNSTGRRFVNSNALKWYEAGRLKKFRGQILYRSSDSSKKRRQYHRPNSTRRLVRRHFQFQADFLRNLRI